MSMSPIRAAILAVAVSPLSVVALATSGTAEIYEFSIPAQTLDTALRQFARQARQQVVFDGLTVRDKESAAVMGAYTVDTGLDMLLAGSGLTATRAKENVVMIRAATETEGASEGGSQSRASGLEEIIVSAQKQGDQLLQEVPIPVAVLDTGKLVSNGQVLMRDYIATLPGFKLSLNYGYAQDLSVRGITTGGFSTPTVGITVDDVSYGASFGGGGGNYVPDIDPGDLERIEALRGPQGTLYGSNSMGGLLRYITRDPSTEAFSARVEAGMSSVRDGSDPGYSFRASANVPVSDTFALRLSAFQRQDPGYIDNPVLGREDVNETTVNGGRVSALWRPSDSVTVKLSALYQKEESDGLAEVVVAPGLGELDQNYIPGVGDSDRNVQAYSAVVEADLGGVNFTSVTGYNVNDYANSFDRNFGFGAAVRRDFGVTGASFFQDNLVSKFAQELRFSGALGEKIDWSSGLYYTEEHIDPHSRLYASNALTGEFVGLELSIDFPKKFEEYAAFAAVTYKFTDRFDVQVGGRQSRTRQDDDPVINAGPYFGAVPPYSPRIITKGDAFTYLLTPRFKLSDGWMLYARLASGYRPGGPNPPAAIVEGAPASYVPDKTKNYEVGAKGDFLDHRFSLDASVYYIDWSDVQVQLRTPNLTVFQANAAKAKSQGVELSASVRPLRGLTARAWVAFNDAEFAESLPASSPAFARKGDRLPNGSRRSGQLSLQQDFPLWAGATGFLGGEVNYVGDRIGVLQSTASRQIFPSYTRMDVFAGMEMDTWTANLFVNNVADKRGLIGGGIGYQPNFAYIYIQPRTVGLNVSKSFF